MNDMWRHPDVDYESDTPRETADDALPEHDTGTTYVRVPRSLIEDALVVIPTGCEPACEKGHTWRCDSQGETRAALRLILSERGQALAGARSVQSVPSGPPEPDWWELDYEYATADHDDHWVFTNKAREAQFKLSGEMSNDAVATIHRAVNAVARAAGSPLPPEPREGVQG